MNISLVPPDLVNTELKNPENIGSIYLIIVRNNSVDPPVIKKTFNELIVSNDDNIHFKYFTGGLPIQEIDLDIIFPEQYYIQANEEVDIYKFKFDSASGEMIKLIQSFVLSELQK